ncbi:HD domain-containing protein [Saccharothrix coeruleofusca]|nr:HD domain-containing protein [Saccharothrix coeruleofusca]
MRPPMIGGHGTADPFGVAHARALTEELLAGLPDRARHCAGVAARAAELAPAVPRRDRELLIAAAWLHDIGYAEAVVDTGFHPLDGARYLRRHGWPPRLCALVANHSGARLVARVVGVADGLAEFPQEVSPVADALTYADQTVDSRGRRVAIGQRLADMLRRHGPDSPNARVHDRREPLLLAAADRVERLLPGA